MKTVRLNEETHKLLIEKIDEMENKYNIRITIESIVDSILTEGIKGYDITKRIN